MSLPSMALPGQLLGPSTKYAPGPGTHMHDSNIYASIPGPVSSSSSPATATKPHSNTTSKPLPLLSIRRAPSNPSTAVLGPNSGSGSPILPEVSSTVLGRITRLGPRFATLDIVIINDTVCRESFAGLIRREDIRATEKDKVKIEESFRVGDIVRGEVVSLGDQSNYYVSTARNELGVVVAKGEGGEVLVPVSWKEVRDMRTGRGEGRKVAKPF
ncbi:hypothetical protein EJ04DRAFT_513069 [Polyplosphaeria fusca]|uniref:S1 motif domain-containing protein n=1 Tax=Polyplosphaeria fusca TaxID=682080 RepID=A0A9P4V0J8_9PLEO|nr:hypothetical protein EJ04DRAFT_513069 [Polyplosphaeria fusca]